MFSYFKHYFIFLNINEHLALPFAEMTRSVSRVSHLCFFCLQRVTYLGIPTVTQYKFHLLL